VRSGSRRRDDGALLAWRFSDPHVVVGDGIVPFLIDWGETPHPAVLAGQGAALVDLRAEHPEPQPIRAMLDRLGLGLTVDFGPAPALVATIEGPRGRVEVR
jgi:hypothetical protein